jgi:signal transduction histidine kinase
LSNILRTEGVSDRLILICLLTAAGTVAAFSWLVFVRVMRPIRALQRAVESVAAGNLDHQIRLRKKKDEMSELADSFNKMTLALKCSRTAERLENAERRAAEAALEEQRSRLEEIVAERTRALRETNEKIEAEIAERNLAAARLDDTMDKLARSNEELQHFAYVASHDLKEPLRKIQSFATLLQLRCAAGLDAQGREFMAYMVDAANRMQRLIDDMLIFSRAGSSELVLEPTDLHALVLRVLSDISTRIAETGAEVDVGNLPTLPVHAVYLGLVFQNLIANAIKFQGDNPPRVRIAAERSGPDWKFSVKDNGIGIDPRHFSRLFLLFQRLHSRAEYPGTGIGLAVCKRIIERHGGRIWVESQVGQGATFYFTLPAGGPAEIPDA